MEMRLFEYALAVARHRSFTRAAAEMCVAQPSLSQQIGKLERDLGVTLFYRDRGDVRPTAEGTRFLLQAEQIVRLRDDLLREMRERREGMSRELCVGAPAITGGRVLPPLLREYGLRHPAVRVRLVEETTEALEDMTAKGLVDLAILALPLADERLATIPLLTEALYLAIPDPEETPFLPWLHPVLTEDWVSEQIVGFPVRSEKEPGEVASHVASGGDPFRESIRLTQFVQAPFILMKQGFGFRRTVFGLCAEAGFQPRVAFETGSIETAQSLVAHGLGVTVVPAMVRRGVAPRPRYLEIAGSPTRTLVFVFRSDRYLSQTARALIATWEDMRARPDLIQAVDHQLSDDVEEG